MAEVDELLMLQIQPGLHAQLRLPPPAALVAAARKKAGQLGRQGQQDGLGLAMRGLVIYTVALLAALTLAAIAWRLLFR